jgi:NADH-quinone oxidoreductase subunit E
MIVESKKGSLVLDVVHEVVAKFGSSRDELIPILNEINRQVGYLPKEALEEVSLQLHTPKSQLFSVATFYHMLNTEKRGKYVIQFCESAPCHVVGGREVWQALQESLHLKNGETSPDGKWTLITTSCLGVCGVGPVMMVNEEIFGNITAKQVPEILARFN